MLLLAAVLCSVNTGCGRFDDPELAISEFDTWKLPASGGRASAPRALHTDADDMVYCLDNAGRVIIFRPDGSVSQEWYMPDYDVGRPEGIVKLQDGRIAVADTHYHRVVFFHPDGTVESMIGHSGRGPGEFVYPVAIAQDPHGFIYVAEYGDCQRIQKFRPDGTYVTQFGEHGTGDGQFQRPSGIVWYEGRVYAVDAFNDRIQVFTDDGRFLRVLKLPDKSAPLGYPYDICGTPDGRLFVAEHKGGRVTVLDTEGHVLGRYGTPGRNVGEFFNPWSLTVLSDGRILVADTGNHRIAELTP